MGQQRRGIVAPDVHVAATTHAHDDIHPPSRAAMTPHRQQSLELIRSSPDVFVGVQAIASPHTTGKPIYRWACLHGHDPARCPASPVIGVST